VHSGLPDQLGVVRETELPIEEYTVPFSGGRDVRIVTGLSHSFRGQVCNIVCPFFNRFAICFVARRHAAQI
jgi:hypothetical protein